MIDALQLFRRWIIDDALPYWATSGFDAVRGRFSERLDWRGRSIPVPHRAMVQARQIYVYSHAQRLGWYAGGALAEQALASLMRDFCSQTENTAQFSFSVSTEGRLVSDVRDAYTHAFVLFALASMYEMTGDPKVLVLARKTNAFIRMSLVDHEHGGLFDTAPALARTKRQNPLMHLLEAYLALERAAPGGEFLEDARAIVRLLDAHLFNAPHKILPEYYSENWVPYASVSRGLAYEPGHHFEWVWLLREFEQITGDDMHYVSDSLYESAIANGIGPHGLIFDELNTIDGVSKRSHRVWPHTEAIKAASARYKHGDRNTAGFAGVTAGVLLDTFLGKPVVGGWIDHVDAELHPLVNYVPASTLYHLMFAAAEGGKMLDKLLKLRASESTTTESLRVP